MLPLLITTPFVKAKPAPKASAPEKPPSREDQGKHVLGHTTTKKPVYASGADGHGYSDDEHQEAARLHAAAHAHHTRTAEKLRGGADSDDDWQRSEGQHGRADAHEKLAAHHFDLVRDHLLAGGHGGEMQMGWHEKRGRPSLTRFVPHHTNRRAEARERLKKRTHAEHPGGASDSDRSAYGRRTER